MFRLSYVLLYALLTSGSAALFLTLNPSFAPERRRFSDRFAYGFWRFGLPGWCLLEAVWWLTEPPLVAMTPPGSQRL
jgi:hypothetical protein